MNTIRRAPAVVLFTLLTLSVSLTGCEIDFTEVGPIEVSLPFHFVTLRSEHDHMLEATITVGLLSESGPPTVRVRGVELTARPGAEVHVDWLYEHTFLIDTGDPHVDVWLEIGPDGIALDLPVPARSGPGFVRPDDGVELPIVYTSPLSGAIDFTWSVRVVDEEGDQLVHFDMDNRSLPTPLVIGPEFLPETPAEALVRTRTTQGFEDANLFVEVNGEVRVPISESP